MPKRNFRPTYLDSLACSPKPDPTTAESNRLDLIGGGLSIKKVRTSEQITRKLREADAQLAAVCVGTQPRIAQEVAEKEVRRWLVTDSLPTKGLEQRSTEGKEFR